MDDFFSRDQDKDQRRWLALGYGGRTADPKNWRCWSLKGGQGPWVIVAPREFAKYRLVGKNPSCLYYNEEVIFKGRQWAAQWHALSHFYGVVVPTLDIPMSEKKAASPPGDGLAIQADMKITAVARVDAPLFEPQEGQATGRRRTPLGVIGEHPWIGREFERQPRRILVLGESYYGSYDDDPDLEHDSVWISQVLDGRIRDLFFQQIPARLGFEFTAFWGGVMFTNLVLDPLGPDNTRRPTRIQMRAGEPRLAALVEKYKIEGILSVGKTQAPSAKRVARQARIAFAATNHPTGANNRMGTASRFNEANAREAWAYLLAQPQR